MLHQLNKLQFEALCATEAQAFDVRHQFAQTCQGTIAEVMDKVAGQYTKDDEWIQIDRIEIDLGNLTTQLQNNNFASLLKEKFEQELIKKITVLPVAETQASKQTAYLKLLIYFLQTGTVPWWAGNADIEIDAIVDDVLAKQPQGLVAFLQQQKFSPAIWQRIAMQFGDKVCQQIIIFFPALQNAEKIITPWIKFIAAKKNIIITYVMEAAIHKLTIAHAVQIFNNQDENMLPSQILKQAATEFALAANIAVDTTEVDEMITGYKTTIIAEPYNDTISTATEIASNEMVTGNDEELPAIEKYLVYNAGTVLLTPYFKQLFTQLNLIEQGIWKNAEAHYKAIHLVRYMATGQLMCPEHELVLEKLLCGMPITAPIPREVFLSEDEKAEATALLKAVIANWEKLKNTSVEGLRETFLKRDGILTKKENGWLLQVERKTVDVLLDTIPWSYSTLAFTWNNYIIFTEW